MDWTFNDMELATYDEAKSIRDILNVYNVGGGVKPGDDENGVQSVPNPNFPWLPPTTPLPGTYQPTWVGGPGGFPIPQGTGGKKFLHFRFTNGGEGMNVGLIREKFKSFPLSPLYVIGELAKEAQTLQGAH